MNFSTKRVPFPPILWMLALPAIVLLAGSGGCHPEDRRALEPGLIEASQTLIDAHLASSAEVDSLISPYRRKMARQMDEVLANCPIEMRTGIPEGRMGALVADIVLERARRDSELPIEACVLNNGGFRVPWMPGEITLGLVYEVMPFENEIVLLRLSGEQMRRLADEIAAKRGEPVAGLSFTIRDRRAHDLRVGGEPAGWRDYWIATNSYLAFGGGSMKTLWEALETRSLNGVLVRSAIADALREFGAATEGAGGTATGVEGPASGPGIKDPARMGRAGLGMIPIPDMGRIRFGN